MKNLLIVVNKLYIKLLYSFIGIFSKNADERILHYISKAVSTKDSYVAFQIKPRASVNIPLVEGLNRPHSLAIVLQGPICTKDNMTLDTILFYQKVYPYAVIIISTWEDEPVEQFEGIKNIVIIKNKKPLNSGIFNVNLQLVSSLAGVKKAEELGCLFSVKTRTDQRMCKPYIFDSMIAALNVFPSEHSCQRGRLVVLGKPRGGMFMTSFASDFMYCGYTEDLIKLLSVKLDGRKEGANFREINLSMSRRWNAERMFSPEIYIFKHYCNDVLHCPCEDTVESFWNIVKDYFIFFGLKDVDLMWDKYEKLHDLNNITGAYFGHSDSADRVDTLNFDFFNWLNLYFGNIVYDERFEKYTDVALVGEMYDKKNFKNGL